MFTRSIWEFLKLANLCKKFQKFVKLSSYIRYLLHMGEVEKQNGRIKATSYSKFSKICCHASP